MLSYDLAVAARTLRKSPGSTLVAVLSLGLAIGAAAAVLGIVNVLFARDIHAKAPEELVALSTFTPDRPEGRNPLLLSAFEEIRRRDHAFASLFAWRDALLRNLQVGDAKFTGNVNEVSAEYFATLGVEAYLGRVLDARDVASVGAGTSARVAVLDYRCWVQRFGSDPSVLGKTLWVDGTPLTVVGVTPREFVGLNIASAPDATVPIGFDTGRIPAEATAATSLSYYVAARLKPRGTVAEADARMTAIWPSVLEATVPAAYQGPVRAQFLSSRLTVESLRTGTTAGSNLRQQLRQPLTQLGALAALVLLVACVNLAGFMLTRAITRRQELALRASLGATRPALIRAMVVEAVMIAFAGAVVGLVAAVWLSPLLLQLLLAYQPLRPLLLDPRPDLLVIAAGGVLALVVGIVSALTPAWRVIQKDPATALVPSSRVIGGRALLQKSLVSLQVSLALVLMTTALLFGRSLYNLRSADPGFRVDGVLQMHLFPLVKQQVIPNRTAYYKAVVDKLSTIPGVDAVSSTQPSLLIGLDPQMPVTGGRSPSTVSAAVSLVGPDFFRTMGMKVSGREFGWSDDERAVPVAVISQSLGERLFDGLDPVGQKIDVPRFPFGKGLQIVGVANNASLWRLQTRAPYAVFLALMQTPAFNSFSLEVHSAADLSSVAPAANKALESFGYHYSFLTQPLKEQTKYVLRNERVVASVSAFLAVLTILLAAAGLYALLAYLVTLRRSEIGIRMAIGAQRSDIAGMILKEATLLVAVGVAVGIPVTLAGTRLAADLIFGLTPYDPATFGVSICGLLLVALVAAYLPARHASRTDPLTTLRTE